MKENKKKSEKRGIVRKIEGLGRLVMPKPMREYLDVKEGEKVEFIFGDNKEVIIKKYRERCIFCDNAENIITYNESPICQDCVEKIKKM